MRKILTALVAIILLGASPAFADSLSIPTWSTGDSLSATALNAKHTAITNWSTTIANDNIKAAAGIVGSKLDLTDGSGRLVQSATLTSDQRMFQSTPTWNSATTTFEAWFLNPTDTASASESLLMDLQLGGTSKFYIGKGTATRISSSGELSFIVASGPTLTFTGTTSISWQRFFRIDSPIITNTSAMTVTDAATVYIASGPRCQGNVTCTGGWALWVDNGGTRLDGAVYINDTSNAQGTIHVTINQAAYDDEIMAFKSSDVDHGMTSSTETDTFGFIAKARAASGGLRIVGLDDGNASNGMLLTAVVGATADTTKTTAGEGVMTLRAAIKSGTSTTAVGADGNLVTIDNNGTTRFIFDAEGSGHADVGWVAFDTHDDLMLLASLEREMTPYKANRSLIEADLGGSLGYSREELQQAKIVNFYDDGPRAMVNFTKLSMLQSGAIRQVHRLVKDQDTKLGWAMARIAQLERMLGLQPNSELATR